MSSIIKVDQIQLADGSTPTAGDLGLNTTGSVLQVVTATDNTNTSITSSSHSNTSITGTITPSSTSSKILVIGAIQVMIYIDGGSSSDGYYRIRNSTNSTSSSDFYIQNYDYGGSGTIQDASRAVQWLDSPASTSAQTYLIQMKKSNGNAIVANNGGTSSLTLIEIAG